MTWQTLLRAMRAPLGVLLFAMVGLLVPPQTKDMLAALEGERWFTFSSDAWWQAVRFEGALALLSMNAWFWAKALVDAEFKATPNHQFGPAETRALRDAPLGLAIVSAAVWAAVVFSYSLMSMLAGIIYVAIVYAISRSSFLGERSHDHLENDNPEGLKYFRFAWYRAKVVFDRVPGPRWLAFLLLALSIAGFLLGSLATFLAPNLASYVRLSVWIADVFPGPGAALFCLALVIPPLSLMTFIADGWPIVPNLRGMAVRIVTVFAFFAAWWFLANRLGQLWSSESGWFWGFIGAAIVAIVAWICRTRIQGLITWIVDHPLSFCEASLRAFGNLRFGPERAPILLLAIAALTAGQAFSDIHTLRVVEDEQNDPVPLPQRADLEVIFRKWADVCAPGVEPVRPVIVAISGGASRAGVWGANVLTAVEKASVDNKGAKVFAVSSVSGGSLGAAAYMSVMGSLRPDQLCTPGGTTPDRRDRAAALDNAPLGSDALGPLLAGAIILDIPRALFSSVAAAARSIAGKQARGGDRAAAIEHGFEDLWRPWQDKSSLQPKPVAFSQPFLSLFYDESHNPRPGMPLWIANGTDSRSGSRLLTVPFIAAKWPFPGALDVLSVLGADVPISTAINNTARFPYLEPGGQLLPTLAAKLKSDDTSKEPRTVEIIDGGYFENEGLQTALDLAQWLRDPGRRIGRKVEPIIVQATGDGDHLVKKEEIARCGEPLQPATPGTVEISGTPSAMFSKLFDGMSGELLTPVFGLYGVRGGHSDLLLKQTAAACRIEKDDPAASNFFHFYLPGLTATEDVPLNWVLSQSTTEKIRAAITNQSVANDSELDRLQKALK